MKGGSAVDSTNPWGVPKVTPLGDGGIELDGPHTPEQLDVVRVPRLAASARLLEVLQAAPR